MAPARFRRDEGSSSFRASLTVVRKGTFSCCFSILEWEHGRASNRQHVRRRLFIRFRPDCQEQKSDQTQPGVTAETATNFVWPFCPRRTASLGLGRKEGSVERLIRGVF